MLGTQVGQNKNLKDFKRFLPVSALGGLLHERGEGGSARAEGGAQDHLPHCAVVARLGQLHRILHPQQMQCQRLYMRTTDTP